LLYISEARGKVDRGDDDDDDDDDNDNDNEFLDLWQTAEPSIRA